MRFLAYFNLFLVNCQKTAGQIEKLSKKGHLFSRFVIECQVSRSAQRGTVGHLVQR